MAEALDTTLRSACCGDQDAWRRIVDEYAPRVFALLKAQCRDAELAEEITQTVFCTLAEKLTGNDGYVEQGKFEAWVFRIAVNRLRDDVRRRQRQAANIDHSALEGQAAAPAIVSDDDFEGRRLRALRDAIDRLPEADRQIIEYRYVGGLSFRQMANLLGEPLGTVLARQHRALRKLRNLLDSAACETPGPSRHEEVEA